MRRSTSSRYSSLWMQLRRDPLAMGGVMVFSIIVLACLLAPLLTPYTGEEFDLTNMLAAPSKDHLLGTDMFGRDLFTRVLYGGRTTLHITLIGCLISLLCIPAGLLSGYFGHRIDALFSRLFDSLSVLPPLLLIVLAETIFGYGEGFYRYALGVAFMPPLFRLARTLTIDVSGKEYVEASRTLGASHGRIIATHVLRNILPELILQIVSTFSDILLYATILGYLEIGVKASIPEWGALVHSMFTYILTKPYLVVGVSSVVSLCVLSIQLFGRGLRDALAADDQN